MFNKFDDILIPINSHTEVRCVDGKIALLKNITDLLAWEGRRGENMKHDITQQIVHKRN